MDSVPRLGDAGIEAVLMTVDDFDSDSKPRPRGSAFVTGSCVPLTTFSVPSETDAGAAAAPLNELDRVSIGECDSLAGVLMPDVAWLIWLPVAEARPFAAWA